MNLLLYLRENKRRWFPIKKNIIFLVIFFIFLMFGSSLAMDIQYTKEYTPIYAKPKANENIGIIKPGYEIKDDMILNAKNEWYKIRLKFSKVSIEAWVDTNKLSSINPCADQSEENDFKDFIYNNVKFKNSLNRVEVIGEITNNSGKDYSYATYMVSVYDNSGQLVDTGSLFINNLKDGQTKSFIGFLDTKLSAFEDYKIQFETGM